MPGKTVAAIAGWNALFAAFCFGGAVTVTEPWQRALLVVLGASALASAASRARGGDLLPD
ncbi:hypothetical protein [Halobacterium jilantaiense]|uniref:Uncharacterized protein n=1 Tax=Halobacterium jilantaiense TaxID=355548 RepID=A0A1I0MPK2_9EURY|nr:hypothetical protein [Halobacterium jilantaiense]SEV89972.1 hypothetical protein SAMN04487945_0231 [Halobacterium jilantaiense]